MLRASAEGEGGGACQLGGGLEEARGAAQGGAGAAGGQVWHIHLCPRAYVLMSESLSLT